MGLRMFGLGMSWMLSCRGVTMKDGLAVAREGMEAFGEDSQGAGLLEDVRARCRGLGRDPAGQGGDRLLDGLHGKGSTAVDGLG